jgi:HAD superfamily hydrolase (TIGR01509 family)
MTSAEELIENAEALLLDFDGPVTALMPPPLNAEAADRARSELEGVRLPDDVGSTTDHLAVLRWTVEHADGRLPDVERACTEAEIACAHVSEPSPEIGGLLATASRLHIPVAIVSNNSEQAVHAFVGRFEWTRTVEPLLGRTLASASLMKPHPHLLKVAVQVLGVPASRCVFIGDAVSDVEAGLAIGVPVIGLAKTPVRGNALRAAGAQALIVR